MNSFLRLRSQYVTIGSGKSNMKPIKPGVPQGSVLGPLLYTIYVNELPEVTQETDTYKDDIHEKCPENLIQQWCGKCGIIPSFADNATVVQGT